MSGSTVEVIETVRDTSDDVPALDVRVDGGKQPLKAEHFDSSGVDAPPLPGDNAFAVETEGAGNVATVGYHDPKNPSKAADGERRTYARDANGEVTAEIWSKGNGDVSVKSLKAGGNIELSTVESGGDVIINGVRIDKHGNVTAPGEMQAMVGTPEAPTPGVKLSKHVHPSGTGPTGEPTPGT